jgi:hypothetical protein
MHQRAGEAKQEKESLSSGSHNRRRRTVTQVMPAQRLRSLSIDPRLPSGGSASAFVTSPSPTSIASVEHRPRQQPPAFQSPVASVASLRRTLVVAHQRRFHRARHSRGVSFAQHMWSNAALPAVTCRLTPRCSGRHPGVISAVPASGVEQLWLRSPARPGGAAELIVRWATRIPTRACEHPVNEHGHSDDSWPSVSSSVADKEADKAPLTQNPESRTSPVVPESTSCNPRWPAHAGPSPTGRTSRPDEPRVASPFYSPDPDSRCAFGRHWEPQPRFTLAGGGVSPNPSLQRTPPGRSPGWCR